MDNILWIKEEITEKSGAEYVEQLVNFIQNKNPITIYLDCNGGDVDQGLAIIDLIEYAKKQKIKVTTIGVNTASMASYILFTGSERYAFPSARIMVHAPYLDDLNDDDDKKTLKWEIDISKDACKNVLIKYGKVPEDTLKVMMKKDYYMSAEEAKKFKLIDKIGVKVC